METIFYALLAGYIVMLVFLLIFIDLTKPGNCVRVFFWPIYGLIYSIGIIFGIFVYLTRKTYRGIIICLEEFKELFISMWYAGEDDD
jgi:hypothetical protein